MNPFYTFLLIVSLIVIAVYYYRKWKKEQEELATKTWPEVIAPCPDFFSDEGNGKCRDHLNLRNRRNCPNEVLDFGSSQFTGPDGKLAKCRQVKHCNISWEGIDNLCTSASAQRFYS